MHAVPTQRIPSTHPQAFDGAVRGLGVGEVVELEMSGGDWRPELLFDVPKNHPEVERLEGRYKKCAAGLFFLGGFRGCGGGDVVPPSSVVIVSRHMMIDKTSLSP